MHANLRSFMEQLRQHGQLIEIDAPVDPNLELAEIHRRVIQEEGPALLFTNVKGKTFPVVTNLFGTAERVDMAFGPKPETIVKDLVHGLDKLMPPSLSGLWELRSPLLEVMRRRYEDGIPRTGSRHPSKYNRCRYDSVACIDKLASGRRSIRYASARLHRASRDKAAQSGDVPHPDIRQKYDRHALADPQGRRFSLLRSGKTKSLAACFADDRRTARPHFVRDLSSARDGAGACLCFISNGR